MCVCVCVCVCVCMCVWREPVYHDVYFKWAQQICLQAQLMSNMSKLLKYKINTYNTTEHVKHLSHTIQQSWHSILTVNFINKLWCIETTCIYGYAVVASDTLRWTLHILRSESYNYPVHWSILWRKSSFYDAWCLQTVAPRTHQWRGKKKKKKKKKNEYSQHAFKMEGQGRSSLGVSTGTPLMQVRFPGVARDFSPRVNFQCGLLHVSIHPCVQLHVLRLVHTLKILQSMSEFGGLWKH